MRSLHDLAGARRLSLELHVPCLLLEGRIHSSLSGISVQRQSTTRICKEEGSCGVERRWNGSAMVARMPRSHRNAASKGVPRSLEADENAEEGENGEDASGKSALPRPHTAVSATCRTSMAKNPRHLRSAKSASTARSRRYLTRVRMLQRRASTLGTAPWKLDDSPGCGYTVELRLQGRRAIEGAPHLEILHLSAS